MRLSWGHRGHEWKTLPGRRGGTHRQLGLTLALLLGSEALLLGSLGPAPLLEETEG